MTVLVLIRLAAAAVLLAAAAHAQPASRPNIVLVYVDDLDTASMEVLDGLRGATASAGLSFTRGYIPNSVCGPSRGSLLTGTYNHTNRLTFNNRGHFRDWRDAGGEANTFSVDLQAAGYRTIHVGKPVNGWPGANMPFAYTPAGWDVFAASVAGVGSYTNFQTWVDRGDGGVLTRFLDPTTYRTDVESDLAVEFIREAGAAGQPFFLYLSLYGPHAEPGSDPSVAIPAARHAGAFAGATVPRDPDFDEADVSDKHARLREASRLPDPADMDRLHASRLESMLAVEDAIRAVNFALEEVGADEDTFLFFVSDNGLMLGHHRIRGSKGYPYERSARVPFVVRGPGIAAGSLDDRLVSVIDLAPTFLELAGAPIPDRYEGRSLAPVLRGAPSPRRESLLLEGWNRDQTPYYRTLVTDDGLKYTEFPETAETETYDLAIDPFEVDDASDALSPADAVVLSDRLGALSECAGAACAMLDGLPLAQVVGLVGDVDLVTTALPFEVRWDAVGVDGDVRVVLRDGSGNETFLGEAAVSDRSLTAIAPADWRGRSVRLVLSSGPTEWVGERLIVVEGIPTRPYDGAAGTHYIGPPAAGMTVADLAGLNLVRGVPGLFSEANPTLWTRYSGDAGWIVPGGASDTLALGRAVRWQLFDVNGVGDPEVSVARAFPFTLRVEAAANVDDVALVLDTDGAGFNYLANPFDAPLDLTRWAEWPGGDNLSVGPAVFDAETLEWVDRPVAEPWQAFRVRSRGPRQSGGDRTFTIPAWAAGLALAPPPVSTELPTDDGVSLGAPIPNPSTGAAVVPFALSRAGTVRLAVFDVRGREVAVLADGRWSAGAHRVRLPAGLAGGVYVVRLEAGGRVLSRRAAVAR